MITIIVNVEVKPEFIEEFIKNTKIARDLMLMEPTSIEYLINQNTMDKTKFVLVESYLDEAAIEFHKTTQHFLEWREKVWPMMAKDRTSNKYKTI